MVTLSTSDLRPSEREFVLAMQTLGFGHFEGVRGVAGQLALDPWPRMLQPVQFGGEEPGAASPPAQFQLKRQVVQFVERVRSIQNGEIRTLEVKTWFALVHASGVRQCRHGPVTSRQGYLFHGNATA